jgi:pimeloyl-ACP methyl ester carboxylesterase
MTTQMLETPEVDLAYDVHGPLPTADGRPPLVMIGQPMDASGFGTLASHFPERTVITYDPRGLGRSTRKDGRVDNAPGPRLPTCTPSSRRSARARSRCSRAAAVR